MIKYLRVILPLSIFIALLLSSCNLSLFDNQYDYSNEINQKLKQADRYYNARNYKNAVQLYKSSIKNIEPSTTLLMKTGICYKHLEKKKNAENYLKRASNGGKNKAYYHLGKLYRSNKQFDKAINAFVQFKNKLKPENIYKHDIDHQIEKCLTAKELTNNPEKVSIKNLGKNINSSYDDYVPVISTDQNKILFTSRREGSTGDLKTIANNYYEDIYISNKKNGIWQPAKNIGKPVNSKGHDATVSLSADGKKLLLYRAGFENLTGEIFKSTYKKNKWTQPEKLNKNINSEHNEPSASMGPNEKTLYFSSDRPGGFGGKDIYKSEKLPTGKWGPPKNLGPVINTPYDEDAPFIHQNNHTLFFSSEGHKNMGGYDIFKSKRDSNDNWSLPKNIGYPINTTGDDIYLILSADGKTGYYSSDKEKGYGKKDIYKIKFEEDRIPVTVFKGKVVTGQTGKKIESTITIMNLNNKEIQGIYSSSENGKYLMALHPGQKYKMIVEANGYKSFIDTISTKSYKNIYKEITKNIIMKKD